MNRLLAAAGLVVLWSSASCDGKVDLGGTNVLNEAGKGGEDDGSSGDASAMGGNGQGGTRSSGGNAGSDAGADTGGLGADAGANTGGLGDVTGGGVSGSPGGAGVGGVAGGGASGVAGINGSGVGGNSGVGGSSGVGGIGGGGTGGTSGSGGGLPVRVPRCLADLYALCPPAGTCVEEAGTGSTTYCYESGTKGVLSELTCNQTLVDTYYKSDGSLCFTRTFSAPSSFACELRQLRWIDANGVLVAEGSQSSVGDPQPPNARVTCSDGSETTICPDAGESIRGFLSEYACEWLGTTSCTSGTCPD